MLQCFTDILRSEKGREGRERDEVERSSDGRLKGAEDNNIVTMDLYWKEWVN